MDVDIDESDLYKEVNTFVVVYGTRWGATDIDDV